MSSRWINGKKSLWVLGLLPWLIGNVISAVAADETTPAAPPGHRRPANDVAKTRVSPGLAGIVKMVEAKVDPQVIRAYIANAPLAFNATAEDIIILKDRGVPNEVLTAVLEHGANRETALLQTPQGWMNFAPPPLPPAEPETMGPSPAYDTDYTPRSGAQYPSSVFAVIPFGPVVSFNNSFPTFVNGCPVYSGYYVPSYITRW